MLAPRSSVLLLALVAGASQPAAAQLRASELGSISQVIDGTKLTVTYSRPRTRERNPIFGTTVAHWGEVWTPGANWATTLETNRDITINQRAVPKGTYSVWMILKEQGDWMLVLDPDFKRFHTEPPDSTPKQVRLPIHVDQAPFVDVLTWSMPELTISGGTLAMQWGTTRASMTVGVKPSMVFTLPQADAAPYLGRWEFAAKDGGPRPPTAIAFTYEDGTLKGRFEPNVDWMGTFAMIRVAPDVFVPGLYDKKGQIYDVLRPDVVFTFKRVGGKLVSFEERYEDDTLVGTGTRTR